MQTKAAIIQYQSLKGEKQANLARLGSLLEQAAEEGAQLVVMPEMCTTGYVFFSPLEIRPLAEDAEGPSFEFFAQLCRRLQLFLVYGFPQSEGRRLFNSQNLIGPKGQLLATYQKRHLFEADRPWATPGPSPFVSCPTTLGRIGLGICMDFNFDDLLRFHQEQETQILCLSMHWVEEGQDVCTYWRWRLRRFDGITLIANAFGADRGTPFCGRSAAYWGQALMAALEPSGEGVLLVDLPKSAAADSPLP
ncbi:MAG: carbon-nitrogen hydrolase family protein [bacterium]|nr:carbon-nitrogen hydrolase family protein [bacterium]